MSQPTTDSVPTHPSSEPPQQQSQQQSEQGFLGKIKSKFTHKKEPASPTSPAPTVQEATPKTSEQQAEESHPASFKDKVKEKFEKVEEFLHLKKKESPSEQSSPPPSE
jgi:hypothetical protein